MARSFGSKRVLPVPVLALVALAVALATSGCGSPADVTAANESSKIETTAWSRPTAQPDSSTAGDLLEDELQQDYIDSYLEIAREGKIKHWLALDPSQKLEVARLWLLDKEARYPNVRPRQMLEHANSLARIYGKNVRLSRALSGAAEAVQSNYLYNKRRKAIQSGAVLGLTRAELRDLIGDPQEVESSREEAWVYRVGDVRYRLVFVGAVVAEIERFSARRER
jgi:hypothetical protein